MKQVIDYYAIHAHCEQCAGFYAAKYERATPAPRVDEEFDYDDGE